MPPPRRPLRSPSIRPPMPQLVTWSLPATGALQLKGAMRTLVGAKISRLDTHTTVVEEVAEQRAREAVKLDFTALYHEYKSKVYGTVTQVVGRTDEIDDIVQVVFLEIHRSIPKYKGQSKLSTWIYRIAVNVALQYIRKRKRRKVFLFFNDEERQVESMAVDLRPRYESRDLIRRLVSHLEKVSEKKRVVFVLHELEGLPVDKIADICEVPVNTVRSRLHAARTEVMGRLRRAKMLE